MRDAASLGVDGFRLCATLFAGGDVFDGDDHLAAIGRVGRSDHAHGKARAVPMATGSLDRYSLSSPDLPHEGQDEPASASCGTRQVACIPMSSAVV